MYKYILYETAEEIDIVTLNSPNTANAFTEELLLETIDVFQMIERQSSARVVILKANGKLFSGGGDIKMFQDILATGNDLSLSLSLLPGETVKAIRSCSKPVIASIQGAAAGAGFGVALACDYRIIGNNTRLVPAFNNIALSGDSALYYFLSKFTSPNKAFEIMTLTSSLSAQEAMELGLVTQVVEDSEIENSTFLLAQTLLNKPTKVIERQKQLLNNYFYHDLATYVESEAMGIHLSSQQDDFLEGVAAFIEKRPAEFKGK